MTKMTNFVKTMLGIAALFVLIAATGLWWLYLYSGDLPNSAKVADFVPDTATTTTDYCSTAQIPVLPSRGLGQNVENATRVAEGGDRMISFQIARTMFCQYRGKRLKRIALEYKAMVQLRRRFTAEQLVTLYLNQAYFGERLVGVESASQHYYGKNPSDLNVGQAAMLAGLLKSPAMYSPERQPVAAKSRRDLIITQMMNKGLITQAQGQAAMQNGVP